MNYTFRVYIIVFTTIIELISSAAYGIEWEPLGRTQQDNVCNFYFQKSGTVFALTNPILVGKSASVAEMYALERYDGKGIWTTVYETSLLSYPSVAVTHDNAIIMEVGSTVFRSEDEGMTWSNVGDSLHVSYIHAINVSPSGAIFLGANGKPPNYRSLDGGLTWQPIDLPFQAKYFYFAEDQIILAHVFTGIWPDPTNHLYRSEDGGDTWLKVLDFKPLTVNLFTLNAPYRLTYLSIVPTNTLEGEIFHSNDAGKNWETDVIVLPEIGLNGIVAYNTTTMFTTYENAGIFRTTNDGDSWTSVSEDLPCQRTGVPVIAPDGGVYVAVQEKGVYRSMDIGNSWENVLQQDTSIYSMKEGPNGSLYVGTFNGDVFRTKLDPNAISDSQVPNPFFTVQPPYPNPFNLSTTIGYTLTDHTHIFLFVYNVMGQQVRTYDLGTRDPGHHEFVFDGSGLSSGVYLYRMSAGEKAKTRRMLLMK